MAVSKDSALYAMILGTEDDPIPALRTAHAARVCADQRVNAGRILDAINGLIDAEIEVALSLRERQGAGLDALMDTHGAAVQTCLSLLTQEAAYA